MFKYLLNLIILICLILSDIVDISLFCELMRIFILKDFGY